MNLQRPRAHLDDPVGLAADVVGERGCTEPNGISRDRSADA